MIDISNFNLPFKERIVCLDHREKWWSIAIGFMRYIWIYEEDKVFNIIVQTDIPVVNGIGTVLITVTCKKNQEDLETCVQDMYQKVKVINALQKIF